MLESVQALAGTTYCKGVQISELAKWAKEYGCWFEITQLGEFVDRGSENEVYLSDDNKTVFKLNDFRYSEDNLTAFFDRLEAHNHYFCECAYELIGFAENRDHKVCAVLKQIFIASLREATEQEIWEELERLGFYAQLDGAYFSNGSYDIFDALPNNVLMGVDGRLYFIDTIIFKSSQSGFDVYCSLSPRFSK